MDPLDALPDVVTARDLATATGRPYKTISARLRAPGAPDPLPISGPRGQRLYARAAAVACLRGLGETGTPEPPSLGRPRERVSLAGYAERRGIPRGTASALPSVYAPGGSLPTFPEPNPSGYLVRDLEAWEAARRGRGVRPVGRGRARAPSERVLAAVALLAELGGTVPVDTAVQRLGTTSKDAAYRLLRRARAYRAEQV